VAVVLKRGRPSQKRQDSLENSRDIFSGSGLPPLAPITQRAISAIEISALGQKQTFASANRHVHFTPKSGLRA
jgi:hypothetical protein